MCKSVNRAVLKSTAFCLLAICLSFLTIKGLIVADTVPMSKCTGVQVGTSHFVVDGQSAVNEVHSGLKNTPFLASLLTNKQRTCAIKKSNSLLQTIAYIQNQPEVYMAYITLRSDALFSSSSKEKNRFTTPVLEYDRFNLNRLARPLQFDRRAEILNAAILHNGGEGNMILYLYSDVRGRPGVVIASTTITRVNKTAGWQIVALKKIIYVDAGDTVWLLWDFEIVPDAIVTEKDSYFLNPLSNGHSVYLLRDTTVNQPPIANVENNLPILYLVFETVNFSIGYA